MLNLLGEILLTSVDRDGTCKGYDIELIKAISNAISIPLIACGGMGHPSDISPVAKDTGGKSFSNGACIAL